MVVFLVILPSVARGGSGCSSRNPGPDISERGLRPTAGKRPKLTTLYLMITARRWRLLLGGMGHLMP